MKKPVIQCPQCRRKSTALRLVRCAACQQLVCVTCYSRTFKRCNACALQHLQRANLSPEK